MGEENIKCLQGAKVTVCGIGGVGGYVAECLARCGVGRLVFIDKDVVEESNINRQIVALSSTVGSKKVDVMAQRAKEINSKAEVFAIDEFITKDNAENLPIWDSDYIVDAIDDVYAKVALVNVAKSKGVPIISAMGAGNRLDGGKLSIADISATHTDPLARKVRKELKNAGIVNGVEVCFSAETPIETEGGQLGSMCAVPAVMGMLIGGRVIRVICSKLYHKH